MTTPCGWLLIGNPENRRIDYFRQALVDLGSPAPKILSYEFLLKDLTALQARLQDALATIQAKNICIRIESPGENSFVEQQLIRLGAVDAGHDAPLALSEGYGQIRHVRYWYLGFSLLLSALNAIPDIARECGSNAAFMNPPDDIALMFDKQRCHQHMQKKGVAVIPRLADIDSYDELRSYMLEQRCFRLFIKLRWGSSASGVVAYEINPDGIREKAQTSAELVFHDGEWQLYNSLKIHCYRKPQEIKKLLNLLFSEGVHIERWIPKSRINGLSYDLRTVAIAGKPAHCVVRKGCSPMTNLHLGNQRDQLCKLGLKQEAEDALMKQVEITATAFPQSHYMGIDLLLSRGGNRPMVIETNAFGDLLPGILFQGQDTYATELGNCRCNDYSC